MKEIDIGITMDENGLNFFGYEEVNTLLKDGFSLMEIVPARFLLNEYKDEEDNPHAILSGFVYKVVLQDAKSVN